MSKKPKTTKIKKFVLDTNVLLHDPHTLTNFGKNDVIVPITVIEELDHFKKDQTELGHNCREVMRQLDSIFPNRMAIEQGYKKPQGGTVLISLKTQHIPELNDLEKADHKILGCAAAHKAEFGDKAQVIMVTKDGNLRIKARAIGIQADDLKRDREASEELTKEAYDTPTVNVTDQEFQQFASSAELTVSKKIPDYTYILVKNAKGCTLPAKHTKEGHIRKLYGHNTVSIKHGRTLHAKNLEQQFLLDALFDDEVTLVTVFGKAGTGKTLLTIAAGLNMVQDHKFDKMLISRAVIPMGKDIGFLPGTAEEKMRPWVQPSYDAVEFLSSKEKGAQFQGKPQRNDQKHNKPQGRQQGQQGPGPGPGEKALKPHEKLKAAGLLEIEVLAQIRGRSIPNAFFMVDEFQNTSGHEAKTVVTRMSEGSKLILIGDPDQIDNPYLDRYSNGLVQVATKLAGERIHAHVNLVRGERSPLAEIAATKL